MSGDKVWSMTFRGKEVAGFMGRDAMRRLDELIRDHDVRTVLELGSFVGMSTCFFAERVEHVTAVDNFDVYAQDFPDYMHTDAHKAAASDQLNTFLDNTAAYDNIDHIVGDFLAVRPWTPEADLIFVDAVQDAYPDIVRAYLPRARKIICGDDAAAAPVQAIIHELGARGLEELSRLWWKIL